MDLIFTLGGVPAGQNDLWPLSGFIDLPQIILYSARARWREKRPDAGRFLVPEEFLFVPDEVLTVEMVRRQTRSIEKRYGFTPRVRLLSNTDELSLALETGQGVALRITGRYKSNPMLRCPAVDLPLSVVLAWRKRMMPPALAPLPTRRRGSFFHSAIFETLLQWYYVFITECLKKGEEQYVPLLFFD